MKRLLEEIKRILTTKEIIPKAVCLLLAVVLWFYVNSTKVGEVKFRIPVELKNLPQNTVVLEGTNKYITVSLTGRKDLIKNVNVKNINASINLENSEIGVKKKYPIRVVKLGIPESVEFKPSATQMELTIEKEVEKRVKVIPDIQKPAKDDFIIGYVKVDPSYVTISGPESRVENIDTVDTVLINPGNEMGRVVRNVSLDAEEIPDVEISVDKVKVIIPVIEATALHKFEIRIGIKEVKENYKYILSKQYVKVYVRARDEDVKPEKEDISAFVDMSPLNLEEIFKRGGVSYIERKFTVNIELEDDDLEVIAVLPEVIFVRIIKL